MGQYVEWKLVVVYSVVIVLLFVLCDGQVRLLHLCNVEVLIDIDIFKVVFKTETEAKRRAYQRLTSEADFSVKKFHYFLGYR